jgi:hypothetical protein
MSGAPFDLRFGCCLDNMRSMSDNSVDSIVTDPPYELGFMGKSWDASGIAYSVEMWREALRVLKPGGHLLSFGGSRTYHRMACAIEDAGFEVRDQIMWVYGSGFPKSLDVSKAIDKAAGAEREVLGQRVVRGVESGHTNGSGGSLMGRTTCDKVSDITAPATDAAHQWDGWGTAFKPAHEPICVARKPLVGTVAANVLEWGTGALNIDGCRVGTELVEQGRSGRGVERSGTIALEGGPLSATAHSLATGRWPANLIHDGSEEVLAAFPDAAGQQGALTGDEPSARAGAVDQNCYGKMDRRHSAAPRRESDTSAARFFYCAKASKSDRGEGNTHPTVKPTAVMQYLCRLVTPPGGVVLDLFMGSGTTGKAAMREGFRFIGFDVTPEYMMIAADRIGTAHRERLGT